MNENGWAALIGGSTEALSLEGDIKTDIAIVGAGFTGMMLASRLVEHYPDASIALVDAGSIGERASGANSGFIVDVRHYQPSLGYEGNSIKAILSRFGIDRLKMLKDRHDIDCQWSEVGAFHVAASRRGKRKLQSYIRGLEEMSEPFEYVDALKLEYQLGTNYYLEGIKTPGGALVQPAALLLGIRDNLPSNVHIFEKTRVESIDGNSIKTAGGSINARRIALCAGGYSRQLGSHAKGIIPLLTFASMSAPLNDGLGALDEWGVLSEERLGSTLRLTRDKRMLIRNSVRYTKSLAASCNAQERVLRLQKEAFSRRFPQFANVPLEFSWHGVIGATSNNTHLFGEVDTNLFVSAGHNGVGIALSAASGTLLADYIACKDHRFTHHFSSMPSPGWVPPDPLLGVGINSYMKLLQFLAGREC